ncbi:MAG: response regulator transcription factor [Spirochaetales bacterium]|nr:response regulator transcription factor [Spirochaetales bacterium]
MEKKKEITFIIIDDHPLFRAGLIQLINGERNFKVVAEAGSAQEALDSFNEIVPDFAIVDISLQGMNGLELIKLLNSKYPQLVILVVSMHDEALYAERALKAGARGYIMKQQASKKVLTAIQQLLEGKVYISENMHERVLMGMIKGKNELENNPIDKLSDREFEVFLLIGRGLGPIQIAEELNLSVKTVETYRAHIKTKLMLENAAELRKHAIKWIQSQKV